MTTDTKLTVKCPRQKIYNTPEGKRIRCKSLPRPKGLSMKELCNNLVIYTDRHVSVEDCEVCQGKELPALRKQIVTYAKTLRNWIGKGVKKRSDEEIERIWKICQLCDALQEGRCIECGCPVKKGGFAWTNKLKMATTNCTRGLW